MSLQEKGVGVAYKNLRLASTRVEWEWFGQVHEFVQRKDGGHEEQRDIEGVWFHHDASGGQDGRRFGRDEVILAKVCGLLSWGPHWLLPLVETMSTLVCCALSLPVQ